MVVLIVGGLLYQIAQKSVPKTANPMLTLALAYTIGVCICAAFYFILPQQQTISASFKELNWTVVLIGASAVMIEVGFLLSYRTGWNISSTSLFVSIAVSLLLIPVGLFFFKEQINSWKIVGAIVSIVGLILLSKE